MKLPIQHRVGEHGRGTTSLAIRVNRDSAGHKYLFTLPSSIIFKRKEMLNYDVEATYL